MGSGLVSRINELALVSPKKVYVHLLAELGLGCGSKGYGILGSMVLEQARGYGWVYIILG